MQFIVTMAGSLVTHIVAMSYTLILRQQAERRQRDSKRRKKEKREGERDGEGREEEEEGGTEAEKDEAWQGPLKPQSPRCEGDALPPARPYLLILVILSNSSTSWWPSIHIYEPMRTIFIQTTTPTLSAGTTSHWLAVLD